MYNTVEKHGVTADEIKALKFGHTLTKHNPDKCPGDDGFKDKKAISILKLLEMQRLETGGTEEN
jgi:hypothetical protein